MDTVVAIRAGMKDLMVDSNEDKTPARTIGRLGNG